MHGLIKIDLNWVNMGVKTPGKKQFFNKKRLTELFNVAYHSKVNSQSNIKH